MNSTRAPTRVTCQGTPCLMMALGDAGFELFRKADAGGECVLGEKFVSTDLIRASWIFEPDRVVPMPERPSPRCIKYVGMRSPLRVRSHRPLLECRPQWVCQTPAHQVSSHATCITARA